MSSINYLGVTTMNNTELANRFRKVADDFQALVDEHGLHDTTVDMGEPFDKRQPGKPLCRTPACHGGWAAIMYGVEDDDLCDRFYARGGKLLARELGFNGREAMRRWAIDNPQHWGNGNGENIFFHENAFGKRPGETLTLVDIIDWYRAVADRMEADIK